MKVMSKTELNLRFAGTISLIFFLFLGNTRTSGQDHARASDKCTTIVVGKGATADGSVLVGHNEDWGVYTVPLCWNPREKHKSGETFTLRDGQVIPQVEETYAFLWPAADCNGINEFQVAITDNSGSCRKQLVQTVRGIDMVELARVALQQSRTARQAVRIMGRLIETYGYKCVDGPGGDIFSVADPTEGWWMEVTIAGQWVAQRVPDDAFVVLANRFRIGEIDLKDSSRFLACSNLVDYAKEKGWYDPARGVFQFSRAYGSPDNVSSPYSSKREWRGNCVLAGKTFNQEDIPLAVVPARKLVPQDIMALLRDHYEGTDYDLTKGYEKGSPHHTSERTICVMSTDASTVAHLRGWLPPEIGGMFWLSAGTPCSSVFVPYYLGVMDFPKPYASISDHYDRDNAYWVFNSLENLVDRYYTDKGKAKESGIRAIDRVSGAWKKFEDDEFATQAAVEKTALELYQTDKSLARSFLNKYSGMLSLQAFVAAQELADTLRTKHYR